MPDRSVRVPETRLGVPQRLTVREPMQNALDDRRVGVELADVAPDVLVGGVPQECQLRLVGPEDRAVGADPVNRLRGILEAVLQLLLALMHRLLRARALRERVPQIDLELLAQPELGLERARALLQAGHFAQARVVIGLAVLLRREDPTVARADLLESVELPRLGEPSHRVGAEQMELKLLGELVP